MKGSMVIIPEETLREISFNQKKIIQLLESKQSSESLMSEFIPESDAKEFFQRKSTWFWQMRKKGLLPFTKVGNRIFYKREDLINLLNP